MTTTTAHSHARALSTHLSQKGDAMRLAAVARPETADWDERIHARCVAEDVTGVRRLRLRDWELLSDGSAAIGGWDLGPTSPEYLLGVVSTCLTHTILCLAAWRNLPLERVQVDVSADNNDAGFFGIPGAAPAPPRNIAVTVAIDAPQLSPAQRAELVADAEATCPVVQALRMPTPVAVASAVSDA